MSISSIGSSSTTSTSALQAQLKADQKTLKEDQDKKASQETLETDQAKVTADRLAIDAPQDKAKSTKESSPRKGVTAEASPSTSSGVTSTPSSDTSTKGVDISV